MRDGFGQPVEGLGARADEFDHVGRHLGRGNAGGGTDGQRALEQGGARRGGVTNALWQRDADTPCFTAVASTSFDVCRGEIFGLLGPNGAGKTTTFRMLYGLLPATSGHLEVAGVNLRTARARARARIGYVSQKFALYGNLTVRENLKFFGGAYALQDRIASVHKQFGLEPSARSGELPGGYKQHLAMAAALLHGPES